MRWIRAIRDGLYEAFIRPVWAANSWLGPLAFVITIAAGAVIGFVGSKRVLGAVVLLAGALILAMAALIARIHRDTLPVPVSEEHRDAIKAIARRYRAGVHTRRPIATNDADWETFEKHLEPEAAEAVRYNEAIARLDESKRVLNNHIGGLLDHFPGEKLPSNEIYKLIVDVMEELVERLSTTPDVIVRCRWEERDERLYATTDVTSSRVYGIAKLSDPYIAAIKVSIEQTIHDVKHSQEMRAVRDAVQKLNEEQNTIARNLDLVDRRDAIRGRRCQDCAPR